VKPRSTRRRYLRIEDAVYQSEAFRTLPSGALKLWIDMRTQLNGYNNGDINATMSTLATRGWTSPETLYRALNELLARGLIDRTRLGKPGPGRVCSLFRFTDLPTPKNEAKFVDGKPATSEFSRWSEQKIRATETEATPLRKSNRNKYGNRSVALATNTETEAQNSGEIGRKAAPVLARSRIDR
jgi:hypothetical protein